MRLPIAIALATLALPPATSSMAAEMYPWRQHRAPYDHLFGNEFDRHQQSALAKDGRLDGYLYVRHTGVVTSDGLPVATHADCAAATDCFVGWKLVGRPARAQLVSQPMHDHPVFWLPRADIAQPGAFAHFHWVGMAMPTPYVSVEGYAIELTATNRFCFIHHGAEMASAALSCRDNGGIAVERGIDIATHLNIVPNDPGGM